MAEKIQNTFYLLKEEFVFFNKKTLKFVEEIIDFKFLDKYFKGKGYVEQGILTDLSERFDIKLLYKKSKTIPKWKGFIKSIAQSDEDILKTNRSYSESYIIILFNKISKKYFVTTGGYGHISVQEISTNDFGLEILSRIIKAEDKTLKATKERSLTGGIQGEIKFFRNDYNIYENENFGNVYNEINATIDKKQLKEFFGFSADDIQSNSLCVAKNSFSLKKSISFNELLSIIEKCENILSKTPVVEINSVEKIPGISKFLINKLYNHLYSKIYANYIDGKELISIEVSHKEFDKYYYSNSSIIETTIKRKGIKLSFDGSIKDIQSILENIKTIDSSLSEDEFKSAIDKSYLISYDENGEKLTEDSLKNHFCAEITMDSQNFFLIEKDWYKMKESFLTQINEQALHFSKVNRYTNPLLKKWDGLSSENSYNASYIGDEKSLVLDKFTPQNIESCDILKWDDSNVYFYHVKKGFDNSMRDLCNQVFVAARRVQEDSKTGYSFLKLLYDSVVYNNGTSDYSLKAKSQFENFSKEQFVSLFTKRQIVFVLAFFDTAIVNRDITTDINSFDSNIAKFSLIELAKKMRNIDVKFQIAQLKK